MRVHLKNVADQVMVITGASSGIGLTTARMAAQKGAKLVLAARNKTALTELVDEIRHRGGEAVCVVADVGKESDVREISRVAIERFGDYDTWVNVAGVGIYGNLLDVSTDDSRRLFETNFWGVVHGSLTAARHFRERKGDHGSAIINVGSEVSDRAVPLIGMYSASKHAVKGFTDALRMELEHEGCPISVTLVKPAAIDTPFPLHAKNYMEQEPTLPPPVYAPEIVAQVILHCAQTPERDMFAGGAAKLHSLQGNVVPRFVDWLMEKKAFSTQKSDRPARHEAEALHGPTTGLLQRSGTRNDAHETCLYTKASMHPVLTAAVAAGVGLGIVGLVGALASSNGRQS
jgi:short-subunit dehydrogenase